MPQRRCLVVTGILVFDFEFFIGGRLFFGLGWGHDIEKEIQ
jgi:hypothetical protein